jgi:hypothetical protein
LQVHQLLRHGSYGDFAVGVDGASLVWHRTKSSAEVPRNGSYDTIYFVTKSSNGEFAVHAVVVKLVSTGDELL